MGTGRIRAGLGNLIGNAGEYAVMSELLKQGIIAALAPRNAPAFDILASRDERTVRLRVKTKSADVKIWQWVVKKDGAIFRELTDRGDFTVLVSLGEVGEVNRYYIVPTRLLDRWLKDEFERWLRTPGRNGRPHSPDNRKRHIDYEAFAERLKHYEGAWERLWGD